MTAPIPARPRAARSRLARLRSARSARPIAGRVVAITGAGRGLGRATAAALAAEGARVAVGDIDAEPAAAAAAQLGGSHVGLAVDVTDRASFAAFLSEAERALGPIDVLVNNAGIMPIGPFLEEEDRIARRQVDVNLHGVILGMKLALPGMLARRRGHVVNIASAAGRTGVANEATYSATKHAVVGLTDAVRSELRGSGVELTVVMPSLANTELASGMRAPRGVPLVEPGDVAAAIAGALRRPRFEVYVPATLGPLFALHALLPQPLRDAMRRLFRSDQVAVRVNDREREAYRRRIAAHSGASEPLGEPIAEGTGDAEGAGGAEGAGDAGDALAR